MTTPSLLTFNLHIQHSELRDTKLSVTLFASVLTETSSFQNHMGNNIDICTRRFQDSVKIRCLMFIFVIFSLARGVINQIVSLHVQLH